MEMCTIVYELLSKTMSNDHIQNELVELLGFEQIELTMYLISNRENVVKAYKCNLIDGNKGANKKVSLNNWDISSENNMKQSKLASSVASDLVVHTESEKRIKKLMMKEQKKLNQMKPTRQEVEQLGDTFDPNMLRRLREEQLSEARIMQLYQQEKMKNGPREFQKKVDLYPHVFDSLMRIKQTSAYVAGAKIMLPENITKEDTRDWEEIHIPATDSMTLAMPEHYRGTKEEICFRPFVKISQLDEVGQIAFRNTKALNRIQSVVFEEAYETNDNLLICAPTGAGKSDNYE